jgi:hypothetical protein
MKPRSCGRVFLLLVRLRSAALRSEMRCRCACAIRICRHAAFWFTTGRAPRFSRKNLMASFITIFASAGARALPGGHRVTGPAYAVDRLPHLVDGFLVGLVHVPSPLFLIAQPASSSGLAPFDPCRLVRGERRHTSPTKAKLLSVSAGAGYRIGTLVRRVISMPGSAGRHHCSLLRSDGGDIAAEPATAHPVPRLRESGVLLSSEHSSCELMPLR